MRRTPFIAVASLVAAGITVVAPASAITVSDDDWTWVLAEESADEMVLSTQAVHTDLAGPGLHVQSWPSTGSLGFPRWGSLTGSSSWGAPTDISGTTGIPGLGVPGGSGGSLTITGDIARWDLDIDSRDFLSAVVLEWQQTGDAHFAGTSPITAIGADLSSQRARAWVADLGAPGWVNFLDDSGATPRGLLVPDGAIGINVYGGSYLITQRMLATAPCERDRSAVLQPLIDGDVTAPITERAQRDLLRCALLPDVVSLASGDTVATAVTLPASITSLGWLDDVDAIGMRVIGLPEGLTAQLVPDGTGGLEISISGAADVIEQEVEVIMWREVATQAGVTRVEPVTGVFELRVIATQLAATGAPSALGVVGAAASVLLLLGAWAGAVHRRRATR